MLPCARICKPGLKPCMPLFRSALMSPRRIWMLICCPDNKRLRVTNDPAGHEKLLRFVQSARPDRVVLESTGGYERAILHRRVDAGVATALINPAGAIYGGRATVRSALYMATLVAIRRDQHTREYYQRLLQRGKPKKVAIVACMHKRLNYLNSLTREPANQTPNSPTTPTGGGAK